MTISSCSRVLRILAIRIDVFTHGSLFHVSEWRRRMLGKPYGTDLDAYIVRDRSKGWAVDIFACADCLYSGVQTSQKSGRRIPVASHRE
ncbi:hypothetical protein [Paraburkholderia bryophila]|uniref:Uncharacterized protein n=1 Tax=Paraburkholderia bryophila TaxID=420952 RepID=A0A7Y9WIW6_9BURK|nr:hypothetical protein [Paraburkholderia bryophila]NYH21687.1 hypothetical protein [Paraburkholderia bryophila]